MGVIDDDVCPAVAAEHLEPARRRATGLDGAAGRRQIVAAGRQCPQRQHQVLGIEFADEFRHEPFAAEVTFEIEREPIEAAGIDVGAQPRAARSGDGYPDDIDAIDETAR